LTFRRLAKHFTKHTVDNVLNTLFTTSIAPQTPPMTGDRAKGNRDGNCIRLRRT
jgi:hypothetical protein